MRSRVYVTVGRLSVRLLRVCCCAPGGQEISIDCCSLRPALSSSSGAARRSAANASRVRLTAADARGWTQRHVSKTTRKCPKLPPTTWFISIFRKCRGHSARSALSRAAARDWAVRVFAAVGWHRGAASWVWITGLSPCDTRHGLMWTWEADSPIALLLLMMPRVVNGNRWRRSNAV